MSVFFGAHFTMDYFSKSSNRDSLYHYFSTYNADALKIGIYIVIAIFAAFLVVSIKAFVEAMKILNDQHYTTKV